MRWAGAGALSVGALAACGGTAAPSSAAASASSSAGPALSAPARPSGSASSGTAPSSGAAAGAASAKPAASPPGSAAAAAAAKPGGKMLVGYPSAAATQSVEWIAEAAGLFKKHGLDVSLSQISPTTLVAGIVSGSLAMGFGPINQVASVAVQGGDLVIAGGPYAGPTYSILASSRVRDAKDLKGRKFAITQRGSGTDTLVADFMKQQGYGVNDYSVTYIADNAAQIAALTSGVIDVVVMSEPQSSIALAQGAHTILDTAQTEDYVTVTALMIRRSFIASRRDDVKRFSMALMEAAHMLKTNPDGMTQYVASYMKLDDPNIAKASLEHVLPQIVEDLEFPLEDAQKILKETAATVPGVDKLKPQDIVDFSVLEEIKASKFLESLK